MAKHQVGTVAELWRYPVKSMLGEKLGELVLTAGGALGDRTWALREVVSGHVASAKKWPCLFGFRASYTRAPAPGRPGTALIAMPDGRTVSSDDPDASALLSEAIGRKMRLVRAEPQESARAAIDPATVFGDVAVEKVVPGMTAATLPDTFRLARGAFFDSAAIHVIAAATLEHLRVLRGGEGIFDPRRFRANIYVKTSPELGGFVEDGWLGGVLVVGEAAQIAQMRPALRCVMTTHSQSELPQDFGILRAAAQHHEANVGVFAAIQSPGTVRLGDPVFIEK